MCDKGFGTDPVLVCKMCEKGTYKDKVEAGPCTPCPEGQTTYLPRSWAVDACYGKKTTILKIDLSFWDLRQMLMK